MIHLITGLPGNAKTLFMLQLVIKVAAEEGREVYYFGIKDFKKDDPRLLGTKWTEFDPKTWHDTVPSGAIIVGDEAQTIFRARAITSNPPPYVTELEQHRHKGLDFYFTTQHPRLVDPALKVLVQSHRHMVRIFGAEMSTVHFWDGIKEKPESAGAKGSSQKTTWAFAKDLYGLYKSADVHTMKRKIPMRLKLLMAVPVVLVACGLLTYKMLHKVTPGDDKKAVAASSSSHGGVADLVPPPAAAHVDPVQDLKDYVWKETPRVTGLPQTAPKYDALTAPTRVPVPAMCIQKGDPAAHEQVSCKCFSQQATPMDVSFNMCLEFARNGFFRDFDADRDRKDSERADASREVLSNRPDSPIPQHAVQDGPSVAVLPGAPMGPQRTDTSPPLNGGSVLQDGPPNNRATRAAAGAQRGGA